MIEKHLKAAGIIEKLMLKLGAVLCTWRMAEAQYETGREKLNSDDSLDTNHAELVKLEGVLLQSRANIYKSEAAARRLKSRIDRIAARHPVSLKNVVGGMASQSMRKTGKISSELLALLTPNIPQ